MPPTTPEDVLKRLVAATDEAKATIRELHEARRDLLEVQRKERQRITDLLVETVEREVKILEDDVRADMHQTMRGIMNRIENDWRVKLGIGP